MRSLATQAKKFDSLQLKSAENGLFGTVKFQCANRNDFAGEARLSWELQEKAAKYTQKDSNTLRIPHEFIHFEIGGTDSGTVNLKDLTCRPMGTAVEPDRACHFDEQLEELTVAWSSLSPAIQNRIMALVQAERLDRSVYNLRQSRAKPVSIKELPEFESFAESGVSR